MLSLVQGAVGAPKLSSLRGYVPQAATGLNYVRYTGATYLVMDTPGDIADSASLLIYMNLKPDLTGNQYFFYVNDGTADLNFRIMSDGSLYFILRNTNGDVIYNGGTAASVLTAATAANILIAMDITTNHFKVYVDETSVLDTTFSITTYNLNLGGTDCSVLGYYFSATGAYDGDVGIVYIKPGSYLDLATASERRKFYSAAGVPTDLSTAPTPVFLLQGDANNHNNGTNQGSGGSFTLNGTAVANA